MIYQNLWSIAKVKRVGKPKKTLMPLLETERRFQTNALNSYLKNQEKLEQNKPKLSRKERK